MEGARHLGFDHVTVAVRDLEGAIAFFGLLGFQLEKAVVVSGDEMSRYMGIPGWEADHVTLVLRDAPSHQEVQLLRFRSPELPDNPAERDLARPGYNHVCFAVDNLDATMARLAAGGVRARSGVMAFHDRRLVLLDGPGGVTVELAEWTERSGG